VFFCLWASYQVLEGLVIPVSFQDYLSGVCLLPLDVVNHTRHCRQILLFRLFLTQPLPWSRLCWCAGGLRELRCCQDVCPTQHGWVQG
jgi:hypothetical protein